MQRGNHGFLKWIGSFRLYKSIKESFRTGGKCSTGVIVQWQISS